MPVAAPSENLAELLHRVFGHRDFRAHQREVCEAATAGRDVLLVMPTGAGKSLCYQLPALARGSRSSPAMPENPAPSTAALVISPLIALMDDQAMKLAALGLRVARIHSGLSREDARKACRDYLSGELDFLFIAPERMRVPGFPEMLAKRQPALVAIDEAHCISAWGHDFRPDYRTLGQHLRTLWPAASAVPIMALTATATPAVQRDILHQLGLREPAVFITGFRRENLAVQAMEMSKPRRAEFTAELLADKAARPAIVYAGSRKSAEELAGRLNRDFPARVYHAGLEPSVRERVQHEFLGGKIDVVVATIAFGMGVDKADVRTVVHVALPSSVEAFYQEIGRAGRDGLPARTVLLYGFADRKVQEFFIERDYPPVDGLEHVVRALNGVADGEFVQVEELQRRLGKAGVALDRETLDRSLAKLIAVGVAAMDIHGDVRAVAGAASKAGQSAWKTGYEAQVAARRAQVDRMVAFAEGHACRMTALVEHFGDTADRRGPCGRCDNCKPETGVSADGSGASAHAPDAREREHLRLILQAIEGRGQSTGKLFTELKICKQRSDFDALLEALARAGLLTIASETFRSQDGKDISYRKAVITHEGRTPDDATLATVWLRGGAAKSSTAKKKQVATKDVASLAPAAAALHERLRLWRSDCAKSGGKPAFVILHDRTLRALAIAAPQNVAALLGVDGLGPAKADQFGAEILAICRGADATAKRPNISEPQTVRVEAPATDQVAARPAVVASAVQRARTPAITHEDETSDDAKPATTLGRDGAAAGNRSAVEAKTRRSQEQPPKPKAELNSRTALRKSVRARPMALPLQFGVRGVIPKPGSVFESERAAQARREWSAAKISAADVPSEGNAPERAPLSGKSSKRRQAAPKSRANASTSIQHSGTKHDGRGSRTPSHGPQESYRGSAESTTSTARLSAVQQKRVSAPAAPVTVELNPTQLAIEERLKLWRREEAAKAGLPSFFIFSDTVLRRIALAAPATVAELRELHGVGGEKLERFGAAVIKIVKG